MGTDAIGAEPLDLRVERTATMKLGNRNRGSERVAIAMCLSNVPIAIGSGVRLNDNH